MVQSQVEKSGGRPFHASASCGLLHLVDCLGLIDLGFTGGSSFGLIGDMGLI